MYTLVNARSRFVKTSHEDYTVGCRNATRQILSGTANQDNGLAYLFLFAYFQFGDDLYQAVSKDKLLDPDGEDKPLYYSDEREVPIILALLAGEDNAVIDKLHQIETTLNEEFDINSERYASSGDSYDVIVSEIFNRFWN